MKFIHIADVHLGAVPDRGEAWSQQRAQEIWDSFRRIIQLAKEQQVELLLIAGDLFHRQPLVRELKEVNYLFSTIPEVTVVLIAGNHDYLKRESAYLRFPWAQNVLCLWEEACEEVELPRLHTWIYGCSYHRREIKEAIYDNLRPNGEEGIHILVAHGGDAFHAPMAYERLEGAGFDYVALGHIHKPRLLTSRMAYSGALEPLDRNDTGKHGYILGECSQGRTKVRFEPFAQREYRDLVLPIHRDATQFSLETQISYEIRQKGTGHLYRLILHGKRDANLSFDFDRCKVLGNITEIVDESIPDYDYQGLMRRYEGTLIGEYLAHFLKKPELTETEELALFYGLQAMLGEHL